MFYRRQYVQSHTGNIRTRRTVKIKHTVKMKTTKLQSGSMGKLDTEHNTALLNTVSGLCVSKSKGMMQRGLKDCANAGLTLHIL